jgi:hypothetical protein
VNNLLIRKPIEREKSMYFSRYIHPCVEEENDPRTHFFVVEMGQDAYGLKRAYLTWQSDSDNYFPKIEELDLDLLGVEIVKISNGSLGHGWIYYRGKLSERNSAQIKA